MSEKYISTLKTEKEEAFLIKSLFFKYIKYWKFFVGALLFFLALAVLYIRYSAVIYESVAKIKIIDASRETNIATDPMALLPMGMGNSINLQNEKEVLLSYRLLSQVVRDLDLDIQYREVGRIKTAETWNPLFTVTKLIPNDSITTELTYELEFDNERIKITTPNDEVIFTSLGNNSNENSLPFSLNAIGDSLSVGQKIYGSYQVILKPFKKAVLDLSKQLIVQNTDKKSEILELTIKGESVQKSEAILNTIISKFNLDGILDKQEVFKRTLKFIDERFTYLSFELDSIERGKEDFKRINDLSYIEADAGISLERKSKTEVEAANLETQVYLSDLLKNTVIRQATYSLLPVDIGLENGGLNNFVNNYNNLAMEREKLAISIGENHPTLVALSEQIERTKVNILKTINVYQTQLKTSLRQLNQQKSKANTIFSKLPEKEKALRSIERQQSIKENLFLLLLQKREEAAINLAVTAPTIKVVDYGLTNIKPIAPKKIIVLGAALLLGLFFPFSVLYIRFALDTKVQTSNDFNNIFPNISLAGEIPHLKGHKVLKGLNDRSQMAESFLILASNLKFLMPKTKDYGKVVYVSSTIEGEGKSLLAYNLSVSLASLNKKVLLVGADLRNPKLHDFFGMGVATKGISNFLKEPGRNTGEFIYPGLDSVPSHKVCLSGPIPPNAPLLLSSEGFETFITQVRDDFDYVIVDTAPLMLVTDTSLISEYADITLLVARAGVTDRTVLEKFGHSKQSANFKNLALVLNDSKSGIATSYTYGAKS